MKDIIAFLADTVKGGIMPKFSVLDVEEKELLCKKRKMDTACKHRT